MALLFWILSCNSLIEEDLFSLKEWGLPIWMARIWCSVHGSFTLKESKAFKLQQKIKNVKKQFTVWNKRVFGKVEKEIKGKQQELQ